MITQIELEHFKCFQLLKLPLRPLTLLSGANASGKSTILQALVLLHQTAIDHEWSTRLQLNGNALHLGTVSDIVDKVHGRRDFAIGLVNSNCEVHWRFEYGENKQDMSIAVKSVDVGKGVASDPDKLRFLMPDDAGPALWNLADRLRRLSYITAERVGPREAYQLQDPSATQVVGTRGENAVGLLYLRRDDHVIPTIEISAEPPTLLKQVEARMRTFFPGVSLRVVQVPSTNIVTLGLRTSDDTDFHRPIHVGFGLTQVLPIVVGALASSSGDLLLIENPEVHLHPAGQALMGVFLSEMAKGGIQVIVETHSDHVLNGIRRAVKKRILAAENVALHFFRPRDNPLDQVISPVMDSSGNIDRWPDGFFDQFDRDMNHFAGWGE